MIAFALPLLAVWLTAVSSVVAQDLNSMPWMDQDSGELKPLGIETRDPAITNDRASIPLEKIKAAPAPTNTGQPWNLGGGGAGLAAAGPVLVYGLAFIGILLLIVLVVWVFMTSRVDMSPDTLSSRPDRSLAESIRHLPFEMDVHLGDFQQQAQTAYQAGDFRMALVFLFSHVLVTLDQAKLVRLKKGKTNRQYLRELSPSRPLIDYYGDVMVPFEQTFFGDYPITREVFEDCWRGLDRFQIEVDAARTKKNRANSVLANIAHLSSDPPVAALSDTVGVNAGEGQGTNV